MGPVLRSRIVIAAALAVGAVGVGAALVVSGNPFDRRAKARRMEAEDGPSWLKGAQTPTLDGPDPVDRAPVVQVTLAGTLLDGRPIDVPVLQQALANLKSQQQRSGPQAPFRGETVVVCSPEVPALQLAPTLNAVAGVGYRRPTFAFSRRETYRRLLFQRVERTVTTGARVQLIDAPADAGAGHVVLKVRQAGTCAQLAEQIVAARRGGSEVALVSGSR